MISGVNSGLFGPPGATKVVGRVLYRSAFETKSAQHCSGIRRTLTAALRKKGMAEGEGIARCGLRRNRTDCVELWAGGHRPPKQPGCELSVERSEGKVRHVFYRTGF